MAAYEGLDAEETRDGEWRWTYTSPGGASFIAPQPYPTKAEATKQGRKWVRDQEAMLK